MLIALGCVTLLALAIALILLASQRAWNQERAELLDAIAAERGGWTQERGELLNRIQRPEYLPRAVPEDFMERIPDPEPDDWNKVGTILNDPEAYLNGESTSEG